MTSYTAVQAAAPLSISWRQRDIEAATTATRAPTRLAHNMRDAHPDNLDYVHAVLDLFAQQAFYYTLTPPKLAGDSVDEFLFEHQARILRTLCLGIHRPDARRRHTGACGDRLSGRNPQPFRGLLDRAPKRCACLVRSVDRGQRLAAHRSHLGDRRKPHRARPHRRGPASRRNRDEPLVAPRAPGSPTRGCASMPCACCGASAFCCSTRTRSSRSCRGSRSRSRMRRSSSWSWRRGLPWCSSGSPGRCGARPTRRGANCCSAPMGGCARSWRRSACREPRTRAPRITPLRVAKSRPDLGEPMTALCRDYSALRYAAGPAGRNVAQFAAAVRAFRPELKPPDSRGS